MNVGGARPMSFAAKITGPTRRVIDVGIGGDWLFEGMARPPAVAWAPALLIAALLLIAPVYLALRTLGAGPEAADLIFRVRTLSVVLRTVALMGAVMVGCVVIAAPLAWLTVRTDLPFRGFWRVATMLPLALPSYIVGFAIVVSLGPVGFLQEWLELRFGVERLPSIYGFPGAAFTLIILSFPYALLPIRAALWNMDATLEESARALGRSRWQTFRSVTLPIAAAGHPGRWAAHRSVHPQRLRAPSP